ncbi:response regulator [Aquincola sp. S2]|uniref:histidine kinase n=1 Tax=Pseudaquabacterium terrae TaxID=2732868 RepID=A0ABX2EIM3_9BURK|nr:response regulator [Aquabacterium terrae]
MAVLLLVTARAAVADEALREILKAVDYSPAQALRDGEEALRRAQQSGDKAKQLHAMRLITQAHQYIGTPETWDEVNQGAALAKELGDLNGLCWYMERQAWRWWFLERDENRMNKVFEEVESMAKEHHLDSCLAWRYINKSYGSYKVGRSAEHMGLLSKAHALFEAQRDTFGIATTLAQIGHAYGGPDANQEDQATAADYYQRSLALIDASVYRSFALETSRALGLTYHRRQDLRNARPLLEKSLAIALEMGVPARVAVSQFNLGTLAKDAQRPEEALGYFDQALRFFEKISPPDRYFVATVLGRAEVLARMGRRSEALEALSRLKAHFSQAEENLVTEVFYYPRAAEVYAQLGEYDEAYRAMKVLRERERRHGEQANTKLADELKVRFQVQLKESENELLRARQKEAEAQQKESEARRLTLVLALALAILLLGSLALYLRRRAAVAKVEASHHKELAEASAAANTAKSMFLANMSHELRSPLNAILGFSRLLVNKPGLPADVGEDLGIIMKSGEHLYSLINQVLDLAKIEAGRTTLSETSFDLYELLDELEDTFTLIAKEKGLQLIVDINPETPQYARTDAVKLRQVLINLLSNAFKFTKAGGVTLQIGASRVIRLPGVKGASSCTLMVSVSDTGPGIAEDELRQLGQAFLQAQAGRQAKEGTGLGLAISRNFVHLMGGELQVTSEVGRGTTFRFDIPVGIAAAEEVSSARHASSRRVVALAPGQPAYRVLVVDDRQESRQLLNRLLSPLGFEVREAGNGKEAIEVWEAWQPQLICMDMRMPVMDGREATQRIKATPQGKATVIIALTASSFEEEREQLLAVGCDEFLRKPFRDEVLFEVMQKHLGVKFLYEEARAAAVTDAPDAASMAALPVELRDDLSEALTRLDDEAIERTIDKIRHHDAGLAQALAALAKRFQYARMLALLQTSSEGR